jgi:hypothetical protein
LLLAIQRLAGQRSDRGRVRSGLSRGDASCRADERH